jgi:hypothetical protein
MSHAFVEVRGVGARKGFDEINSAKLTTRSAPETELKSEVIRNVQANEFQCESNPEEW